MAGPDVSFWQARFDSGQTAWDRGGTSPQLQAWLSSGALEAAALDGAVAVPGCGSGHEVAALAERGITVIGVDYTPQAVARTRERLALAGAPAHARVAQADVLAWQPDRPLAAVYEQTCLCALHPDQWTAYAGQLHRWLRPGGRLFALFMQARRESAAQGVVEGPPYHSDINAMRALFPAPLWQWPKPPYDTVAHPSGLQELAVVLTRA